MSNGQIDRWQIYHMPQFRHARPHPKNKFVVIGYTRPAIHCFLINSQINEFFLKNELTECFTEISVSNHSYLDNNSFIDCTEMFEVHDYELTDPRDILTDDEQRAVWEAVQSCPILPQMHKDKF